MKMPNKNTAFLPIEELKNYSDKELWEYENPFEYDELKELINLREEIGEYYFNRGVADWM